MVKDKRFPNKIDINTQRDTLSGLIKENEEIKNDFADTLYGYTPNEESLEKKVAEAQDASRAALERAERALDQAEKALKEATRVKGWLIALVVILVVSFLGWIYTSIIRVQDVIDDFNERAIPLESEITEFKMERDTLHNEINSLHNYIDIKVESEVNKALLDFYKNE